MTYGRANKVSGLVLGKFMPPHLGHVYLIEFAKAYADDLTVVVGSLEREPIPGALRARWVRELFPDVNVVHLTDENPQEPHEHPRFWDIWRESLRRVVPGPIDHVFASEAYGARLAHELGASFVPVDPAREILPVSGTAIRNDPYAHWAFIPRCVRPYFAIRVSVFGPESTGKTTIAKSLAAHYETVMVPEYARLHLERQSGEIFEDDMPRIARGQIASEDALVRDANRVLICDTDVLATTIWSESLFGRCASWMHDEVERRRYDLTLLTDIDVPWEPDPVRYLPDDRRTFHARCEAALTANGRHVVKLRGSHEARLSTAIEAIDALLARGARST